MIIELNNLVNQTLRIARNIPMSGTRRPAAGISYAYPVDVDLTLIGKEKEFKIVGSFSTKLLMSCHRCLNTYELPIRHDLDLVFIPRDQMPDEMDVELADEDMNIASYLDSIDLCQVIDEQVVLSLPMKSLCAEDCKGLCQHCGKNLNEGPCGCSSQEVDGRLAALKEIKGKILSRDKDQAPSNSIDRST
jgi:uncharacterized protein